MAMMAVAPPAVAAAPPPVVAAAPARVMAAAPPNQAVPQVITVTDARTKAHDGLWPNDQWHLQGSANGKPQWVRQGNPQDVIKWDGRRWALNGDDGCYFRHATDTPLPPTGGWGEGWFSFGVDSMPTLE